MSVMYFPRISAADFEAFRMLLKDDIGATFNEWLQRLRDRIAEYSRRWPAEYLGQRILKPALVEVTNRNRNIN
jgi:hypothetical protein